MTVNETGIAIDATNFPDANFRQYLLGTYEGKDGKLVKKEIEGLTWIDVSEKNISSLKGIELLSSVKTLICNNNQLKTLDLSKNTALEWLSCYDNQLTALDVSKNTALERIFCNGNQLTALDVSKNTVLKYLSCRNNQLTALDVSQNTALLSLSCYKNQLTALDVSKNTELTNLSCDNNQLTALDVSKNTELTALDCSYNQLTALDVSKNTELTNLYCYNNQLTALDVSKNTALGRLSCHNNRLTALDVSKNTAITYLSSDNNQLTALDVSKNTELTNLSCDNNQLTALDVSKNTELTGMDCDNNQLTALDVSKNTALGSLSCHNNRLTALDVSKNTELTNLYCYNNQLTALDVSQNTSLEWIFCYNNQLTALDVSQNTALKYLYCYNNQLTALDVSKNTVLTTLGCSGNQLTSLDLSKNKALTWLNISNNDIKDATMDALIGSLPDSKENKTFRVINKTIEDRNVCTKAQVAAAKEKGWTTEYWDGESWNEYEGSDEIVILPQDISLSDAGYATFYSSESAYLLPNSLSAQVVINASDSKLEYKTIADGSVAGVIPKETAVMLTSDGRKNGTYTLTPYESTATYSGTNLLHGSDEATMTTGDGLHYKLTFGPSAESRLKNVFGWYWGAQNGAPFQIEGHKAWLVVPQGNGTRAAGFSIEGDVLGIEALGDGINSPSGNYFDLQGRRIQRPTRKGIYISNGKKIVNK